MYTILSTVYIQTGHFSQIYSYIYCCVFLVKGGRFASWINFESGVKLITLLHE